jgi:hypothetical protein
MSASFDSKFIKFSTASGSALLTSLISYWKLNETSGDAVDAKGLTNLVNSGATQNQAGKLGTAYTFNGTSSFVGSIDTTYEFTTPFTISAWVKTSVTGAYQFIVSDWGGSGGYCLGMTDTGYLDFEVGGSAYVTSGTTINSNAWVHVVGVWNGTDVICYVNNAKTTGSALASFTYVNDAGERFEIGRRRAGLYWNGSIDEVGVWNRALSDSEVSQLYNSGTGLTHPF